VIEIPFELSHEFSRGSTPEENSFALKALLDCLITLDRGYLRGHPGVPSLYASGIVYVRTRAWLTMDSMLRRGYGDCKSLAAAVIAERAERQGIFCRPVFRDIIRKDGLLDFHILVQIPNGTYEDPSKVLGMEEYQFLTRNSRE
jgi:hypothetical protein